METRKTDIILLNFIAVVLSINLTNRPVMPIILYRMQILDLHQRSRDENSERHGNCRITI